jgi:thiamine kinase-like enzyme
MHANSVDPLSKAVERLSEALGPMEREPVPLEGGITNRNYRARFGGEDVVIRLPGKDTELLEIDRRAERAASEGAAAVGVGPEVLTMLDDPPCLVTRFIAGRPMSAEDLRAPGALVEVAAAIRRVHEGQRLPVAFSPFRIVEYYAARAAERGTEPSDDYDWGHGLSNSVEAALAGPEHDPVPCHNDLLAANFLRTDAGIRVLDWEYAGMGDRFFDLGNFAVNNELDHAQEAELLAAYFGEPAPPARLGALRLMRFMSDFREAMWGGLQSALSDIDFDFRAYAAEHFERMRETAADPAFGSWLEEARAAR